jgi:hypothetical protein
MKYVIDRRGNVVIGSARLLHADLAAGLDRPVEIASAGFCFIEAGKIKVGGRSVGFGIESKPEDADLIAAEFNL